MSSLDRSKYLNPFRDHLETTNVQAYHSLESAGTPVSLSTLKLVQNNVISEGADPEKTF